jgi:putative serine esterase DUF676
MQFLIGPMFVVHTPLLILQVSNVISCRPGFQKISFIAHSLGGLVARYAIGKLYEPHETAYPSAAKKNRTEDMESVGKDCQGRIAGLEPMNFVTVATPHLGSRGHRQVNKSFCHVRAFFSLQECCLIKCLGLCLSNICC